MAGNRHALRPTEFVRQRDDARPGRRALAVLGLAQHHTGDVLARHPAFLVVPERSQFAAVERKRTHRDQRLVSLRAAVPATSRSSTGAVPFGVLTRASMNASYRTGAVITG